MIEQKPLNKEEINTVRWYCKNSEDLRSFLDCEGFQNVSLNPSSLEYVMGGTFRGVYAVSSAPPTNSKEVEFINNNLYWKGIEMKNPDSDEPFISPLYAEIDRTMGTLECTNLQEDVRGQFLHHLSRLLRNVRKNLYGMED